VHRDQISWRKILDAARDLDDTSRDLVTENNAAVDHWLRGRPDWISV
jgi:hypothetical protein